MMCNTFVKIFSKSDIESFREGVALKNICVIEFHVWPAEAKFEVMVNKSGFAVSFAATVFV